MSHFGGPISQSFHEEMMEIGGLFAEAMHTGLHARCDGDRRLQVALATEVFHVQERMNILMDQIIQGRRYATEAEMDPEPEIEEEEPEDEE